MITACLRDVFVHVLNIQALNTIVILYKSSGIALRLVRENEEEEFEIGLNTY
jgi:hypothetical protein